MHILHECICHLVNMYRDPIDASLSRKQEVEAKQK